MARNPPASIGDRFRSLTREGPTCPGTTELVRRRRRSCALEPGAVLLRPRTAREAAPVRSLRASNGRAAPRASSPRSSGDQHSRK